MQINKKSRRTSTTPTEKGRKVGAESRVRADKTAARKAERAGGKGERQDRIERKLRDELEGTGAQGRVRDIVTRLLGDERSPGVEAMIARLQSAAKSDTASPYGP